MVLGNIQSVKDTVKSEKPYIGHVFEESTSRGVLHYPMISDGEFSGMILFMFDLSDIIQKHGNIETEEEQFLFVIDKNYNIIVDPVLVGENLFEDSVTDYVGMVELEREHYAHVLDNNEFYTSVYTNNLGERIDTGSPVVINGEIEYYLFIITPTAPIYSIIGEFTSLDQIQTVALMIVFGFFVVIVSFKQRKRMKQDKLAMIGQLASNIAHDIRNPLATIKTASVIIGKENKDENGVITREIERIRISSKQISHQVEDVLNYVRTTPLQLKENSIFKTLEDAVNSIEIPENIKVHISEKEIRLPYDHEKLLIVFVNVILNAIQAIGENQGKINIQIDDYGNKIVIKISNTGPPIPEKVLPKIFEPLFTTNLKGTGLGLSSCYNIVTQHGGTIKVEPDPVTYFIEIPKEIPKTQK